MNQHITDHADAAEALRGILPQAYAVGELICSAYGRTPPGVLYTFGNGGSAADAQHLSGEMIGRYQRERRPLPAVTLTADATVTTCIANDYDYSEVFARQVTALARPGDVVAGFTTSGSSPNVIAGLRAARQAGAHTVLFAGAGGGPAQEHADHALLAPSSRTPRIQEMHTLLLHIISEQVDLWATEENG